MECTGLSLSCRSHLGPDRKGSWPSGQSRHTQQVKQVKKDRHLFGLGTRLRRADDDRLRAPRVRGVRPETGATAFLR